MAFLGFGAGRRNPNPTGNLKASRARQLPPSFPLTTPTSSHLYTSGPCQLFTRRFNGVSFLFFSTAPAVCAVAGVGLWHALHLYRLSRKGTLYASPRLVQFVQPLRQLSASSCTYGCGFLVDVLPRVASPASHCIFPGHAVSGIGYWLALQLHHM